ncbi:B3 domain-containing transcription factor VRN1 [Gossypium raimondii]|uniref:TF-B3 domain-containing protein n=2 Tax=Gossypium raimondii TaxID=29730 RepID=A0A0D2QM03_GOSRA|nr:B3 domain-containing transcription factor VRN1 [Gossypium raimondii]KJB17846.1 hypothetical protein B456_003G020800 [Gossypium raimondii]
MAASSHQQGNGHLKYISDSPYFFKIILQDNIQNGKLGIPKKFVKNHGNGMSSPAMFSVPSGEVWKVELTKCDGKIWCENGWLEFSNHYSLYIGHLLVFRYDGNSNFHVIIFDRTATEIQYPYTSNYHRQSNVILEQNIDQSRKPGEESQLPRPRPRPQSHKMVRSTKSAMETETEAECNGKPDFPARNGDTSTNHNTVRRLNTCEKVKALERARNTFKSENPFFLVVIQPDYVGLSLGKRYRLAIPADFVRENLMKEHCSITLCHSSGKTWMVTFKQQKGQKLYSFLQTGWVTFVRDNNIQVGDVCAFEAFL